VEVELVAEPGALDQIEGYVLGRHVKKVFGCWVIVFGLVGAQMGWVLRPFVGSPGTPFQWFRERESSFFEAVLETVRNLF
jgi:2-keto-3-deoxy-galactonokinase